jgi:hypothetical protein
MRDCGERNVSLVEVLRSFFLREIVIFCTFSNMSERHWKFQQVKTYEFFQLSNKTILTMRQMASDGVTLEVHFDVIVLSLEEKR